MVRARGSISNAHLVQLLELALPLALLHVKQQQPPNMVALHECNRAKLTPSLGQASLRLAAALPWHTAASETQGS